VDQTLTTPVRKFGLAHSKDEAQKLIEDSLRWPGCGQRRRSDAIPTS